MWNNYLLKPLRKSNVSSQWILPVIHGYFNQTSTSPPLFSRFRFRFRFRYPAFAFALSLDLSGPHARGRGRVCRVLRVRAHGELDPALATIALLCRRAVPQARRHRGRQGGQRRRVRADTPRGTHAHFPLLFITSIPPWCAPAYNNIEKTCCSPRDRAGECGEQELPQLLVVRADPGQHPALLVAGHHRHAPQTTHHWYPPPCCHASCACAVVCAMVRVVRCLIRHRVMR